MSAGLLEMGGLGWPDGTLPTAGPGMGLANPTQTHCGAEGTGRCSAPPGAVIWEREPRKRRG